MFNKKKKTTMSIGDRKYANRTKNLPNPPDGHVHAKNWDEKLDRVVKLKDGSGYKWIYNDGTFSYSPKSDSDE